MQPMVTQLCQLLTKYNIKIIPSKEDDQSCVFSLTSPGLPEILMSILSEMHSIVKQLQLPAPESVYPVITLNKQVITKVYFRNKLKGKR
jgi:hypothetical protein